MKLVVFAATGLAFFTLFVVWLQTQISYRIGSKHLKIQLFGLVLRRIDLTDIKRISKRKPSGLAEHWYSTTRPKHRILAIQRYGGLRKNILISPRNRYVFMSDLEKAIKRVKPQEDIESLIEPGSDDEVETATQ
jgi:hypothetical protein